MYMWICIYMSMYLDGSWYSGDLVRTLQHGAGVMSYTNGDIYDGSHFPEPRQMLCIKLFNLYLTDAIYTVDLAVFVRPDIQT